MATEHPFTPASSHRIACMAPAANGAVGMCGQREDAPVHRVETPDGVFACGPNGRLRDLPPEDVATIREFARLLTNPRPAQWCRACHQFAVRPDQHECTPPEAA